ncbi:MAG: LuxR C-terminal-related transcriptional regulator [Thermodesulfobacteriota bacterium]|nr:LuxR C-terminal-related transcriptional regulator [Thermodesulfobacteriota bacterium]
MNTTEIRLGYYAMTLCSGGAVAKPGATSQGSLIASFKFDANVSALFPYVNAVAARSELYDNPQMIRFMYDEYRCVLYPEHGIVTPLYDRRQAELLLDRLLVFLNDIYSCMDDISPNHKLFRRVSVLDILKLLPQTNCRECGFPTCMAFAACLSLQEAIPAQCPHLGSPMAEEAVYPVYDSKGNLRSTVTIDINTKKANHNLIPETQSFGGQEKSVSDLSKDNKPMKDEAISSLPSPLTSRELEVLRLIAQGNTNTEISRHLEISPHTVKSHVIHIFNKVGVNDRTQAAVWATRQNLI